jgi:hypothetical protein
MRDLTDSPLRPDEAPPPAPRWPTAARAAAAASSVAGCAALGWRLPPPLLSTTWCVLLAAAAAVLLYVAVLAVSVFPAVRARVQRALERDLPSPPRRRPPDGAPPAVGSRGS